MLVLLLAAMGICVPAVARADDEAAEYRGRVNYTRVDEAMLWGPRILFFPFHLIAEYGIRKPIFALGTWMDSSHFWPIVALVLRPTNDFQWRPTFMFDLGVDGALGAELRTRNVFVRGNELRSSVSAGFYLLEFNAEDKWRTGPIFAGIRQHTASRNRPYYGLGPDTIEDNKTFFGQDRWEAFGFGGVDAGQHANIQFSGGYRREVLGPSTATPSVQSKFDLKTIPGIGELNLAMAMADIRLDTRRSSDQGSGVRFVGNATYARDVVVPGRSFLTAEVDAEASLEIVKPDRVLGVRFYGAESVPFGTEPVPMTHLPMLGWNRHLGFIWGRFRGESAVMAEIRYRYPIAYYTQAQLALSAGNVFARDFHDFDMGKLTTSFAFGVRTIHTGIQSLELMVGFGTTRFEQAFAVDSVRLYIGTAEHL